MRRYDIEHAVLAAELPGPSVALMLALCTRIWVDEGLIPMNQQPSLSRLAADTGYDRSTVMRHLNDLETDGWVTRIRPPVDLARRLHVTTAYAMAVPPGYAQARGTGHRALGALTGDARRAAAKALEAQADEARRASGHGLGDDPAAARGTAPHKTDTSDTRHPDRAEACAHGVPGGDQLHPRSRKPKCPMCRLELAEQSI